jgi:ABC-type branched-subunit amino acid transport system substrate-binding protein
MKILLAFILLLTWQQSPTDTAIRIGIIIPSEGGTAKAGEASRSALEAYIDEVNNQGGIGGRKIEVCVAMLDKDWETTAANLKRLTGEQRVLAFVGGIIAGRDQEIERFMQTEGVPLIGAASLNPPAGLNPHTFHTLPGIREQARAMVNFAAAKPELLKAPALIFSLSESLDQESAEASESHAKKIGWLGVNKIVTTAGTFKSSEIVNEIKLRGVQTVFVYGNPTVFKALLEDTIAAGLTPTFLTPGYSATPDSYASLTSAFKNKIFLSLPTVPGDITATEEYRALQSKHNLPTRSLVSQFLTLAAAKIMIEGLRQSGGLPPDSSKPFDVKATRERLITGLEKLREFNTGMGPRITFARDRHVGSLGAHIIAIDPDTKQLTPLGFVSAN